MTEKTNELRVLFREAFQYGIVGGLSTILDAGVLYALTTAVGINYLVSSVFSFLLATVLNYILSTQWVFSYRRVQNRVHEFGYYLIITAGVLALNTVLMWSLTDLVGLYFMVSKLITIFFTFGLNFALRKVLLHQE